MKKFKDLKPGDTVVILRIGVDSAILDPLTIEGIEYDSTLKEYVINYKDGKYFNVFGEDSSLYINPTTYLYASPSLAVDGLDVWYNSAHDSIAKEFDEKVNELTQKYNKIYEEINRLECRG